MRRHLRPFAIAVAALLLWPAAALAGDGWYHNHSDAQNFKMGYPAPCVYKTTPSINGQPQRDECYVIIAKPLHYYGMSVLSMPDGKIFAKADMKTYQGFVEAYANGTGSTVVNEKSQPISGQPGLEAVLHDDKRNLDYILDIMVHKQFAYLMVSIGADQRDNPDAARFRDSFQLLHQ